jgi:hypothetical protein
MQGGPKKLTLQHEIKTSGLGHLNQKAYRQINASENN